jgi:ankyrin repeat protein
MTALIRASSLNNAAAVRALVDNGAKLDARDKVDATALWEAAAQGSTEAVKALLAAGAKVDAESNGGDPLLAAAKGGHVEVVQLLKAKGAE